MTHTTTMTETSTAWLADEARKLGAPAHVVELVRLGAPLVRLAPGTRTPLDRGWPQLAARHYVLRQVIDGHRQDSIDFGVCCGLPWAPGALIPDGHGLVVLDIEAEHLARVPSWPTTPTATSANGGRHCYLALPLDEIAELKCQASLRLVGEGRAAHLGELKSARQLVVAYPFVDGLGLADVPMATALPDWLDRAPLAATSTTGPRAAAARAAALAARARGAQAALGAPGVPRGDGGPTRAGSRGAGRYEVAAGLVGRARGEAIAAAAARAQLAATWPEPSYPWAPTDDLRELIDRRIDSRTRSAAQIAAPGRRGAAIYRLCVDLVHVGCVPDLDVIRAVIAELSPGPTGLLAALAEYDAGYLRRTVERALVDALDERARARPGTVDDAPWAEWSRIVAADAPAGPIGGLDRAQLRVRVHLDGEPTRRQFWISHTLSTMWRAVGTLRQLSAAAGRPDGNGYIAPGDRIAVVLSDDGARALRFLPAP